MTYKEKIGSPLLTAYRIAIDERASATQLTALILRGARPMSRYRYLTGILLTFVMGAFPIAAHAGGKSNATYDSKLAFGSQLLYLDDGCLSVNGSVTSGNFFDNLKRTDVG